ILIYKRATRVLEYALSSQFFSQMLQNYIRTCSAFRLSHDLADQELDRCLLAALVIRDRFGRFLDYSGGGVQDFIVRIEPSEVRFFDDFGGQTSGLEHFAEYVLGGRPPDRPTNP